MKCPHCKEPIDLDSLQGGPGRPSKVHPALIDRVCELRREGMSLANIAEKVCVSKGLVHKILKEEASKAGHKLSETFYKK